LFGNTAEGVAGEDGTGEACVEPIFSLSGPELSFSFWKTKMVHISINFCFPPKKSIKSLMKLAHIFSS
jgi:hypothetical protein